MGVLTDLIPKMGDQYGINFLISYYLRIAFAIKIWSENSVPATFVSNFLSEHLNKTTSKIIQRSDVLISLIEKLPDKLESQLKIKFRNIAIEENKKIEESNGTTFFVLFGIAAAIIFFLFIQWGLGFLFWVLATVTLVSIGFFYGLIKKDEIFADDVSKKQVSSEYNRLLKEMSWLKNEIDEAQRLANAMENGPLSIFPILNLWNKSGENRSAILKYINLQIQMIEQFKIR